MGIKFKFGHIGTQCLLGAVLMITASTNTLGLQSSSVSLLDHKQLGSIDYLLISPVNLEPRRISQRKPTCTPGFSCSTSHKVTNRVSGKEAVRFALFMGAGSIN